jgi:ABC-2 type transport system ATP-binding protein
MLTTSTQAGQGGTVTVFGTNAASQPMRARRLIGYVPQLMSALLTRHENVELFARLFRHPAPGTP